MNVISTILIPSMSRFGRYCNGDGQVVMLVSLRRLLPWLMDMDKKVLEGSTIPSSHFLYSIMHSLPISMLLKDQSPMPQYVIRLLSDVSSLSHATCKLVGEELCREVTDRNGKTRDAIVHDVIALLTWGLGSSNDPRSGNRINPTHASSSSPADPQVAVLLRHLVEKSGMEIVLLQMGLPMALVSIFSHTVEMQRSELAMVLLDLLLTILQSASLNLQKKDSNSKLNLLTDKEIKVFKQSVIILSPLINQLFLLLNWRPRSEDNQSNDSAAKASSELLYQEDCTMLFLLWDSVLRCITLFVDLIPDSVIQLVVSPESNLGVVISTTLLSYEKVGMRSARKIYCHLCIYVISYS